MTIEWLCSGKMCRRGGALLARLCDARIPRWRHDTWLRYRHPLQSLPPSEITLTRLDAAMAERLRCHPERDAPQVRSALRFWEGGFGDGYLWLEADDPLCMMWLVTTRHAAARTALGSWAGMYPPVPPGVAVAEGLHTFRRGLRRPGGAATLMSHALFQLARRAGLRELRTHIHVNNAAAQRWAARVGWEPCGKIHRCFLDIRWAREHPVYIHQQEEFASHGLTRQAPDTADAE